MINIPRHSISLANRWKLNTLSSGGAKHMWDWSSVAIIILALSSSGAKRKYFLTSAQGLSRNVTYFKIPFEQLDHYPKVSKVSKQKKVEFDRLVLSPPPLPLYRGRDVSICFHLPNIEYWISMNIHQKHCSSNDLARCCRRTSWAVPGKIGKKERKAKSTDGQQTWQVR